MLQLSRAEAGSPGTGPCDLIRVVLDGSVEKVTISGLDVDLCPLHATWELGRPG